MLISRYSFLWGVTLWAAFHLIANGDLASVVLFVTFLVVAAVRTTSIDHKRDRVLGDAGRRYAARTSNVPFGAIITRRTRFSWREIGVAAPVATLIAFGVIVWLHPLLFHANAVPMLSR